MSVFLLDTDSLSFYRHNHPLVSAAVTRHRLAGATVGTTVVTVEEQCLGWFTQFRTARTPAALALASRYFAEAIATWGRFPASPLTVAAIGLYEGLKKRNLNVGKNDLRIAAIALELGATVITHNRRDFGRVPGLLIDDWSV
jgi:tRNA(fMet)-specific endonuclease VapC